MPLDPEVAKLLDGLTAAGFRGFSAGGVEEAREAYRRIADARRDSALPPVADTAELTIGGIPARVYRSVAAAAGTLVYFHGGGYVVGDLDTHDVCARLLCAEVGVVVVSVGYRLAPEHRYPTAVEDAVRAVAWTLDHAGELGGPATPVGVAGDSAGGNLAAVCAQHAAREGWPLAAQALLYPNVDFGIRDGSFRAFADGPFLTARDIAWFFGHYAGVELDDPAAATLLEQPRLDPLRAPSLDGLAPAVVATAECDPLRDQGRAYAQGLAAAGVPTVHREFAGLAHGFYPWRGVPGARAAASWINAELRRLLRASAPCEVTPPTLDPVLSALRAT